MIQTLYTVQWKVGICGSIRDTTSKCAEAETVRLMVKIYLCFYLYLVVSVGFSFRWKTCALQLLLVMLNLKVTLARSILGWLHLAKRR